MPFSGAILRVLIPIGVAMVRAHQLEHDTATLFRLGGFSVPEPLVVGASLRGALVIPPGLGERILYSIGAVH